MGTYRTDLFEIWSRRETGDAVLHGRARGLTFQDACKQLACDSIEFWRYHERDTWRGQKLFPSAAQALEGK